MALKNPQQRLDAFLARQPSYVQKWLQLQSESLTNEDCLAVTRSDELPGLEEEYQRILKQIPTKWRAYRKKYDTQWVKWFLLPRGNVGRPPKDDLAAEASKLRGRPTGYRGRGKKSYGEIALVLNRQHGPETATRNSVRHLIRSRRAPTKKRRK